MKYQSEIVKQLIEEKGHYKSLPHYESECIEAWVEANKSAYPKLTDYQAEWLNYANEHPIGMFPYETLTNITEATIENVVPYAYKSAILSGNTLVNLGVNTNGKLLTPTDINYDVNCSYLEVGKTYYVIVKTNSTSETGVRCGFVNNVGTSWDDTNNFVDYSNNKIVAKKHTLVKNKDSKFRIQLKGSNGNTTSEVNNLIEYVLILEYQDGMENWDIPYFEGMQSVKMPVLKATGKNLFDGELELGMIEANGGNYNTVDCIRSVNYTSVKPNTPYSITNNLGYYAMVYEYDANLNVITHFSYGGSFTTKEQTKYIRFRTSTVSKENNLSVVFQIEQGAVTTYEPYKSNILTVNEDVTLRGIGNVKDELDCLTGEVTERIGNLQPMQLTFDSPLSINTNTVSYSFEGIPDIKPNQKNTILSNALPQNNATTILSENEGFYTDSKGTLVLVINKSRLTTLDKNGLLKWLTDTSCEIIYIKSVESIKTVVLTVSNQNGDTCQLKPIEGTMHLETSSDTIHPSFSGEIPVEATTQNLASFIEE